MDALTSRVLNNGNNQAVHIPAEFRLDTDRVRIHRNKHGDLVIHPLRAARGAALLEALQSLAAVDPGFIDALENERGSDLPMQERDSL